MRRASVKSRWTPKRRTNRLALQKRSRAARVNVARGDSVSSARVKTIKKIAKKVVMTTKETKFTKFDQRHTTLTNIPAGDRFYIVRLTDNADIFPSQGDSRFQRDGVKYRLLGFNVFFSAMCERMNINSPLEVRIIRFNYRANVRTDTSGAADNNGLCYMKYLYPQTESTDVVSFTRGVAAVVGRFDPQLGRVVKSFKIRPDARVIPGNNLYHMATPADVNVANEFKYYSCFVPYKSTVTADDGSAQIPLRMPKFAIAFRCAQQNTTAWDIQYVYTQAVFKDL